MELRQLCTDPWRCTRPGGPRFGFVVLPAVTALANALPAGMLAAALLVFLTKIGIYPINEAVELVDLCELRLENLRAMMSTEAADQARAKLKGLREQLRGEVPGQPEG